MVFVARGIRYGGPLALAFAIASGQTAAAATPSVEAALKLAPVQAAIDYDVPAEAEIGKCTIKAESIDGRTGWVVRSPSGEMLRQFADTNNDNVVDQWCYYSGGLEVYRDIDSNFNGKADQYRWLNTAGSRWGVDEDEDGKVDAWKMISAEEVCAEAVEALARRDLNRFERLLLAPEELKRLGIGGSRGQALQEKLQSAPENFRTTATKQKLLGPKTAWLQMGGSKPGLVPAGADGGKEDLLVYENVISMVETEGKPAQVQIGTLIQFGQGWRLVDAPIPLDESQAEMASNGVFFAVFRGNRPGGEEGGPGGPDQKTQELLAQLEKLDQAAAKGDQASKVAERCDLLEQIAERATTAEDQAQWLRSLAETLSAAVQTGSYPEGLERLKALGEKLASQEGGADLAAYVKFRHLTAEYNQKLQDGEDFLKSQKKWLQNLEQYIADYPNSPDAAEAMLQLGIAEEFAGEEEGAKKWYGQIVDRFAQSPSAQKAAGAVARLDSVGKPLRLRGASIRAGKAVDVAQYRDKVVLVQYWATWCEPCKADMAQIRELQAKYAKELEIVSISLDSRKTDLEAYLKKSPLPWHHIYEPGGLDSRLANELGVLTLPTMLLLDQQGKVANRNVNISELDREIKSLLR
jgi:thiol-disulfide isomerase/thioredoxin